MIDYMGSDLTVVNAARVSFNKESKRVKVANIDDKDHKAYQLLWRSTNTGRHSHTASSSFSIEAPLFVARQLIKHQVGLAWNEVSRRYVDTMPRFYTPTELANQRADNVKQGSSDTEIDYYMTLLHTLCHC